MSQPDVALQSENGSVAPPPGLTAPDPPAAHPRRGVLDRDWQKILVIQLTVLAGVALLWVLWQILSPIRHTLALFAFAGVLAFALSGPVEWLTIRLGRRVLAIAAVYLLAGGVIVGGLTLLAGPFVRTRS